MARHDRGQLQLIIPIEWIIWLLALPSGLLIGYYANQRSDRRGRTVEPDPRQRAVRRFRRPADVAVLLLRIKAIFFYADTATPTSTGPGRTATDPADCRSGPTASTSATSPRARPGPRRRRCHGRRVVHEFYWAEQFGTAGTLVLVTTIGGLGGAALYGVFRPKPSVAGAETSRGRRRLVRLVTGAGSSVESKRPGRTGASSVLARHAALFLGRGLLRLGRRLGGRLRCGLRASRPSSEPPSSRSPSSRSPSAGRLGWRPWRPGPPRRSWPTPAAALAAAASARAVLLRAARALPAAVWAPLALPALPAAMRALAALAAAALPVVFTTRPPDCTCSPPRRR